MFCRSSISQTLKCFSYSHNPPLLTAHALSPSDTLLVLSSLVRTSPSLRFLCTNISATESKLNVTSAPISHAFFMELSPSQKQTYVVNKLYSEFCIFFFSSWMNLCSSWHLVTSGSHMQPVLSVVRVSEWVKVSQTEGLLIGLMVHSIHYLAESWLGVASNDAVRYWSMIWSTPSVLASLIFCFCKFHRFLEPHGLE